MHGKQTKMFPKSILPWRLSYLKLKILVYSEYIEDLCVRLYRIDTFEVLDPALSTIDFIHSYDCIDF